MPATPLREVSERFGHFYVPRFELSGGGSALSQSVIRDVISVTYNDSTTDIDSIDVTINNWDAELRQFKYVGAETSVAGGSGNQRLFNPNASEFELKFGYGSALATIMRGFCTSLEPTFPAGGAPTLTVRLLNVLHRLRTKKHRDHWPNRRIARGQVKLSRVAQDVGQRRVEGCAFPIPIRINEDAMREEPVLDYLAQDNLYDIDFLLQEARKVGYVVYVDLERAANGDTREVLYFGPSDAAHPGAARVTYELKWGISLIDFAPKLTTANQVTSVEVRAWNRATNRAIRERASLDDAAITVNRDLFPFVRRAQEGAPPDRCREREETVANTPTFTPPEARRHAARLLNDRLSQLVEANGTTVGLPDLRAGQRVHIVDVGERFSGEYFVTKTTHTFDDNGYRTKFTARRERSLASAREPRPAEAP